VWTCTSDAAPAGARRRGRRPGRQTGFSLIEVVLGIALALCLALRLAPVWLSFEALAAREGDATVWASQGRVAVARLEKDARLAGFDECSFQASSVVLQASSSQVVLLVKDPGSSVPILVEWEIASGALMRRWGPCPDIRPAVFPHSLYIDSKTMLDGVDTTRSAFAYSVARRSVEQVGAADLQSIDGVRMDIVRLCDGPGVAAAFGTLARVGR
jgi:type II secretory pathway pseudopilin PulG